MGSHVTSTSRSLSSKPVLSSGADVFLQDTGHLSSGHSGEFHQVLELLGVTTLKDSLLCCAAPSENEFGVVCTTGIASGKWETDDFEVMEVAHPWGTRCVPSRAVTYDSASHRVWTRRGAVS
jgi:hypothetical protein